MSIRSSSSAWVHFSPRDLFAWVQEEPVGGLALNAYKDRRTPQYYLLKKSEIADLAQAATASSVDACFDEMSNPDE